MPREDDALTEQEQEIAEIVGDLRATGNLRPLIDLLRGADGGPEHARDALRLLGELDVDVLVQLALDTLIEDHFDDPASANQTRRVIYGETR